MKGVNDMLGDDHRVVVVVVAGGGGSGVIVVVAVDARTSFLTTLTFLRGFMGKSAIEPLNYWRN